MKTKMNHLLKNYNKEMIDQKDLYLNIWEMIILEEEMLVLGFKNLWIGKDQLLVIEIRI